MSPQSPQSILNFSYLGSESRVVGVSDDARTVETGIGRGPDPSASTTGDTVVLLTSTETYPEHKTQHEHSIPVAYLFCQISVSGSKFHLSC